MASLRTYPKSPFWVACYRRQDGKQTTRSTKLHASEANRKQALAIAEAYESAYREITSVQQAQKVMDHITRDILGKSSTSPKTAEWMNSWTKGVASSTSPRTATKYSGIVAEFLEWLGDARMSDLTRETLTRYRDQLAEKKASSTVNGTLKILRTAFHDAIRDGVLSEGSNPADIRPLRDRGDSVAKAPFSEVELAAMWSATEDLTHWRGMLMLGLFTGQRIRDLATLRWSQIDMGKGEIRLEPAKLQRKKKRILILLAQPLRDWMSSELTVSEDPDALIFPEFERVLGHQASGWLSNGFRKHVMTPARVGLPIEGQRVNPKSFHSLRHTLPSLLAETGVSQQTIAEIVGHDSMAMSWHYTHISRDEVERAVGSLRNPFSENSESTNNQK